MTRHCWLTWQSLILWSPPVRLKAQSQFRACSATSCPRWTINCDYFIACVERVQCRAPYPMMTLRPSRLWKRSQRRVIWSGSRSMQRSPLPSTIFREKSTESWLNNLQGDNSLNATITYLKTMQLRRIVYQVIQKTGTLEQNVTHHWRRTPLVYWKPVLLYL